MNKKICIKCKIEKDGNLFSIKNKYFSKKKQKTVFYYNPICKICDSKRLDKLKNKTNRSLAPKKFSSTWCKKFFIQIRKL